MKYLAIRYYAGGFHAILDDNGGELITLRVSNMENIEQARKLYYFLNQQGFNPDAKGTIHVVAFGICRLEIMSEMWTLPRYVSFDGGMLNPNLLYVDKKSMVIPDRENSDKPEVIIEMVREFFLGKRKKHIADVKHSTESKRIVKTKDIIHVQDRMQEAEGNGNNTNQETRL